MIGVNNQPIHSDYYKYPSSDGEPMAESTLHFNWIVTIKENLELLAQGHQMFVAGDLLWYPVKGKTNICKAPDVMVAIGRPKGDRLSYLQWHEGNVAPQVVFEIFSKSNRRRRNKENLLEFYTKYGVEEYYTYDPVKKEFIVRTRSGGKFNRLEGLSEWVSPLLGIRFRQREGSYLEIFHPDGRPFLDFKSYERKTRFMEMENEEIKELYIEAQSFGIEAKKQAEKAEAERDIEREKRMKLEQKLKELGIDPTSI